MRSEKEIMQLILNKAKQDERIRACYLNGSRADENATHDKYCDYDIVYVVDDIRSFTNNPKWVDYFGERLIMQTPDDWYSHPYDYDGTNPYGYLMQFIDGNRIDLTLVDVSNISRINAEKDMEPRRILLDKDGRIELYDVLAGDIYNITPPTEKEYFDICNEFWWLTTNIVKGICREELHYVKVMMEQYERDMLLKMLSWKIGIEHDFNVSIGKCHKYLKRYLSDAELIRFMNLYPNGTYSDIKEKLFLSFNFFEELAEMVATHFDFEYRKNEAMNVRNYVEENLTKYWLKFI